MIDRGGRVWAAYTELEEYDAGMWRRVSAEGARAAWLTKAVELLRDIPAFEAAMRLALRSWPRSCLVAFTNPSLNKPVWLAHAGAALTRSIPEEFMRLGYWELNDGERKAADDAAERCAAEWRREPTAGLPLFDWMEARR
jgi:hypothetical protein